LTSYGELYEGMSSEERQEYLMEMLKHMENFEPDPDVLKRMEEVEFATSPFCLKRLRPEVARAVGLGTTIDDENGEPDFGISGVMMHGFLLGQTYAERFGILFAEGSDW